MRILVLDDDKGRLSQFKQKLIGHIVDCAETAKETIELLKKNKYEQAFLDHDLCGKVHQPSGPGTGYEVAKWLKEHEDKKPLRIVVHSYNLLGAKNMISLIPEADYIPGVWLLDKMEF